jgi:cytochrome c biogenesis protein CcmG, thiol:disulfide interchange protein DsbE
LSGAPPGEDPPTRGRLGLLVVAAVVLGAVAFALWRGGSVPPPLERGRAAPPFELADLDGSRRLKLADLRGRVVLLNFWATWCKPCEDEMPAMQRLYRTLGGSGFELVAISVDTDAEAVARFRDRLGLSFPILLDPGSEVSRAYQTTGYPESFLIDRAGNLASARFVGPRAWDDPEYQALVRRVLESNP